MFLLLGETVSGLLGLGQLEVMAVRVTKSVQLSLS
jgi:hypothetical protein